MTRKLLEGYRKWGLEVNVGKTEQMSIEEEGQIMVIEECANNVLNTNIWPLK